MSSDDWDLIRFELPEGKSPMARNVLVFRNGAMIQGLVHTSLELDINALIKMTTTQYVRLEGPATLEDAVQALEEREAIWNMDERAALREVIGTLVPRYSPHHPEDHGFTKGTAEVIRRVMEDNDAEQQ